MRRKKTQYGAGVRHVVPRKKARSTFRWTGPFRLNPATTYSPTELPLQYHRRWRA